MSSTHISALPENVLIKIFEHLYGNKEQSNLINATLVCTLWNRIISQTHNLLNKLQLQLHSKLLPDALLEKGLEISRDYRHLVCHYERRGKVSSKILNEILTFDQLTTLEIKHWQPSNAELMENFQNLSKCKFLRSLTLTDCELTQEEGQVVEEIERIEFEKLKKIKLCKTTSSYLNFIRCKELDSFSNDKQYDAKIRNSDRHTVAFLNQLDRCDEIYVNFQHWNFTDFEPKFLWNRLRLTCELTQWLHNAINAAAISSIKTFLEASTTDATADITFEVFLDFNRNRNNLLWLTILNSCRVITTLTVRSSNLPSNVTQLRDLTELQTLKIDALILKDVVNFSHFESKIRNVTKLSIFSNGAYEINLTSNARLNYQPFFNQITELTLDSDVVDSTSWPQGHKSEQHHLISNLLCENLTSIRINKLSSSNDLGHQLNELFLRFCKRNKNLRQMKVFKNIEYSKLSEFFIGWYNQLQEQATTIKTCNVLVIQEKLMTPTNWRDAEVDEVELFRRNLTEDENRFFI